MVGATILLSDRLIVGANGERLRLAVLGVAVLLSEVVTLGEKVVSERVAVDGVTDRLSIGA